MKKKILIVEDEVGLLEMYKIYFEQRGYEVLCADNGGPGIAIANKEKPDLILLDILMPALNGWEALKKLKGDIETNRIPILIFSNLGQLEEIEKGLKLGADDYIVKTDLTPSELVDKVERILERHSDSYGLKRALNKKVLIVERMNDNVNPAALQKELLDQGFKIEATNDCAEGIRLAKIEDFNLILISAAALSPVEQEMIRDLRRDPRTKDVPLIIISDAGDDENMRKNLNLNVADYLMKTKIDHVEITKKIKDLAG